MIIKKCDTNDILAVGAFYDKVVQYLIDHINYPHWTYKDYPSEKSAAAMTEEGSQYICLEKGVIVGAFVLNEDPQGKYENARWSLPLSRGDYMIIHGLAVDPDCHGQGIGGFLVQYCLDFAKSNGYKAIRLDVVPGNFPAMRLYERYGFCRTDEADLERGIPDIPTFVTFERNL